ncbi:hypothetical protein BGP79_10595 [Tersicoccus sp. Bi-70]|nr:hypothetical protein BGP79_10595 [Tersicoccus sp. Bi-70]
MPEPLPALRTGDVRVTGSAEVTGRGGCAAVEPVWPLRGFPGCGVDPSALPSTALVLGRGSEAGPVRGTFGRRVDMALLLLSVRRHPWRRGGRSGGDGAGGLTGGGTAAAGAVPSLLP